MRVVVVGAGLGGLSAACHLAGRGHDVVVVERDTGPGGRAGQLARQGYLFDTGPTVLTMPSILEETFAAAGVDMADVVHISAMDPLYRASFADGSSLCLRPGRQAMVEEIRACCGPHDAEAFPRFAEWLTELYRLEMPAFIERNYDSALDLVRPLGPVLRLVRMGGLRRLASKVADFFEDGRLQRVFTFQAMYAGLSPFEALALYSIVTYMDSIGGVFRVDGGMHSIATGLAAAAEKAGATLRYESPADRILLSRITDGVARGVLLESGETIRADAVVCNPDLPAVYRLLLPGLSPPRRSRVGRYSPSAVVWHAGVRGGLPPDTAHHNIHFGRSWDRSFRALLDEGRRMPDPSFLVTVPTVDEPSLAPPGRHTLYVLEPVPNLDAPIDWTTERARAYEQLVGRVASMGYPVDVEVEAFVDPADWERAGMERGTPFALAHRFSQSGPFRPGNMDRRIPGVVFVGSGTVPGVGVPMVLISGRLAADRVESMATR